MISDETGSPAREETVSENTESRLALGGIRVRATVRAIIWKQESAMLLALLACISVFTFLRPSDFATVSNIENLLMNASILSIISVGMTFIIIMGVFDLSVGSVLVFAQISCVKLMGVVHGNGAVVALVGLIVACLAGCAWGWVNGFLVARLDLSPFIVTLATFGAALGAAQLLTGGNDLTTIPAGLNNAFSIDKTFGIPNLVLVTVLVALIGGTILAKTRFGSRTYAIGSNKESAARAGLPVARHITSVYVLMGLLAGLAGYLEAARLGTTSINGHTNDALDAITAVALGGASLYGGVGTMLGSMIGVGIPAVLQNGLVILGTQPYWYEILVAAALVISIYFDRRRRANRYRAVPARGPGRRRGGSLRGRGAGTWPRTVR
jgi:ribose transport system permease protein